MISFLILCIDFGMDQCLQLIAHQSHSVDADWIVKYRRVTESSILGFCGDTEPASFL